MKMLCSSLKFVWGPENDRTHKLRPVGNEAYNLLKSSVKSHGLLSPIFIDARNNVLLGHYRLMAWMDLGNKEVEIQVVKNIDEAIVSI